jgi:Ser/Thr protein kinase RdoA (MazF antagonist)
VKAKPNSRNKPKPAARGGHFGDAETRFFYELTPDRILAAVEAWGLRPTGRCLALASMENRVYQVEIDLDEPPRNPNDAFRVIKFYRPGRWTEDQILEEHRFLLDLVDADLPVVAPLELAGGDTLARVPDASMFAAVFPRKGGRAPDELAEEDLDRLGRLLARLHSVGAMRTAKARLKLDIESYARPDLAYLVDSGRLPASVRDAYRLVFEAICQLAQPWFAAAGAQRIHGDCHRGNVLWGSDGPMLVDFDDMVVGPCVQDLWLLVPGRDEDAIRHRRRMVEAYEQMRDFDRTQLRLIEPLRAMRVVHFSAWIARRWEDPAFPRVFPEFGTERYWFEELASLREIHAAILESTEPSQ